MIFFVYELVSMESDRTAGAMYASCWINLDDVIEASRRAIEFLELNGYKISEQLEAYPITRETSSTEGLKYFEQALIDNEVVVIFESEERPGGTSNNTNG